MIKRNLVKVGVTAAAIAATGVLIAPSATAATLHYRVHAGSHASGTASYTGRTNHVSFVDNGVPLNCTGATATGVLKLGNNLVGANVGTITKTTWTGCSALGGSVHLKVAQLQTWHLNLTSRVRNGVTHGNISAVRARVTGPSGCSFVVTGKASGHYTNRTHKLTVKSGKTQLTIASGSCLGVVKKGQHPTFSAVYTITSPKGRVTINNH